MELLAFGPFLLDSARGRLTRDGVPVPLGQKALSVLGALAECPGRTVSKEHLLARAWPDTIVEEGNLTVQVAGLRRALGAADGGKDWILTVPRVGYRLGTRPLSDYTAPVIPSLAVLAFEDLGVDPGQNWFADGVVDDIITALSRFRSFALVARSSSFAYKGRAADVRQVARELGVRYVLEGSVRRAGDTLRITSQLVDGITGAHLWAERFDGSLGEVFAFQDRITADVAFILEPQIQMAEIERSRRERPGSIAAYDACLPLIPLINKQTARENAEAYALLNRALAQEPDNPLLLSHAGWALGHRSAMGWPPIGPDDVEACVDLARRALHHAAGDPIVMAHSGLNILQTGRQYDWGMSILESAAEANPNHQRVLVIAAIGHLHCGSLDQALAYFHRATSLSPNAHESHAAFTGIAHAHVVLGNHAEALVWATRSLAINTRFGPTYWMLVAANAHLGRKEDARRHLAELRRLEPDVTVASIRAGQCARDAARIEPILAGLKLAGLPEA